MASLRMTSVRQLSDDETVPDSLLSDGPRLVPQDVGLRAPWVRRSLAAFALVGAVAYIGGRSRWQRGSVSEPPPAVDAAVSRETIDAKGLGKQGFEEVCAESGVDFQGYNLEATASESVDAAACKVRCQARADCLFFTWHSDDLRCHLKWSDAGRRSWGHSISGPRTCPGKEPTELGMDGLSLASNGLCNVSMATVPVTGPRSFNLPSDVLEWCKSDAVKPPGAWTWPGRNWCWLNTKKTACYNGGTSLPNWWWAQEHAAKRSPPMAPEPTQHLLAGMLNPMLCDLPQHGAPLTDISAAERVEAEAWVRANLNIYVINLPTDTERWASMEQRWKELGFDATRIEGIMLTKPNGIEDAQAQGLIPSGWSYELAKENAKRIFALSDKDGQKIFYDAMGIGTVGCAAAHLHAQRVAARRAAADGRPLALVMEDDVWVQDDFAVRLRRLLALEAPCDWDAIALTSRCSYGFCVSPHLSKVEPDGNEPNERCRTGVNFGMYGTLYRASEISKLQRELLPMMWNDTHAGCLPIDIAMAAISDKVSYYAVPSTQRPGFMYEKTDDFGKSDRRKINKD